MLSRHSFRYLALTSLLAAAPSHPQQITRTTLGPNASPDRLAFSEGFAHVAYVGDQGSRQTVFLDGKPGVVFDKVISQIPVLSADGRHCAYAGKRGLQSFVSVDGKEYGPFDEVYAAPAYQGWTGNIDTQARDPKAYDRNPVQPMLFSPDGAHFAFIARSGGQEVVMEDGKQLAAGHGVVGRELSFSSVGNHLLFAMQDAGQNSTTVYVDNVPGPPMHTAEKPRFTTDGKHVFYIASRSPLKPFLVLDGKAGPAFSAIHDLTVSRDGSHVAYVGMGRTMYDPTVVVDGRSTAGASHVWMSSDGQHVAYLMANGRGRGGSMVIDGKPGQNYDSVDSVTFTPKGGVIYRAMSNQHSFVVVNGTESPAYLSTSTFLFSDDGQHFAYIARDQDGTAMVLDGRPLKHFSSIQDNPSRSDSPHFTTDGSLVYFAQGKLVRNEEVLGDGGEVSPDGKHVASLKLTGQGSSSPTAQVTIDGKPGPVWTSVLGLTFSPDSRHYAYAGGKPGNHGGFTIIRDGVSIADAPDAGFLRFSKDSQHLLASGVSHTGAVHDVLYLDGTSIADVDATASYNAVAVWSPQGHELTVVVPTLSHQLELLRYPEAAVVPVSVASGGAVDLAESKRLVGDGGAMPGMAMTEGNSAAPLAGSSPSSHGRSTGSDYGAPAGAVSSIQIASGTEAHLRLLDAVDSLHPPAGGYVRGELTAPLPVVGVDPLPSGTQVSLQMTQTSSGWELKVASFSLHAGSSTAPLNHWVTPLSAGAAARIQSAAETVNNLAGLFGKGTRSRTPAAGSPTGMKRLILPPATTLSFIFQ